MSTSTFSLPSPKQRALLDRSTSEYAECVDLARDYLTSRGFETEWIDKFRFGYVLDPVPGHEMMKGRLSIPYVTPAGVVNIKFRCIEDHGVGEDGVPRSCKKDFGHEKYYAASGAGTYLYGIESFWADSPYICITEGELDRCTAVMAGMPAVGVDGATKWQAHWQYCFEGYEEVVVLRDGDKAGEKLADNVTSHLYTGVRVITFPDGEDVNSIYVKYGAQALRERCGLA